MRSAYVLSLIRQRRALALAAGVEKRAALNTEGSAHMSDNAELLVVVDEDGEEYEYEADAVQVDDDGVKFIEIEDENELVLFEIVLL